MPDAISPRRMPLLPLAGLLLVALAMLGATWLSRQQANANAWVAHTLAVELRLGEVRASARALESAQRGYLITGRPALLGDVNDAAQQLVRLPDALRGLTRDNPAQSASIDRLDALLSSELGWAQRAVALAQADHRAEAFALVDTGEGRALMTRIEALLGAMRAREEALLAERTRASQRLVALLAFGQAAAVLLLFVVAVLMVRDARRQSRAIVAALREVDATNIALRAEMAARSAAEGQVRQMQKMESIGQLTGGIAHDFNNMLAIVIGSLDLAERRARKGETAKLQRCLDAAREGAERAAALTARLLAFSRQQPLAPIAVEANRLVTGMSELLRRTLGEHIAIETVLAGGLWRTYADPGQLENAILNLAVNARDAMPGGGKLTIETANAHLDDAYARERAEVAPGQYVLICVSDTGEGMAADVMERAFDPFFTTKAVGKGTGLGLSQVFGFVKQSGGHVSIYSEPGEGTTLKLYLPRYAGPAAEAGEPAPAHAPLPEGRAHEVVLVVEDEQRVRHFSVDALRELGYSAMSAANGAEALAMLEDHPGIRLLFTDVVMPEMDGRRLAERARAARPDLRILYTTGYTRNAVVHNGMLDAGVAFLPKPFTIAQLAWKVREVLDGAGINRPV